MTVQGLFSSSADCVTYKKCKSCTRVKIVHRSCRWLVKRAPHMTRISCYIAISEEKFYMLSGLLAELSRVITPATELSIQLIESALLTCSRYVFHVRCEACRLLTVDGLIHDCSACCMHAPRLQEAASALSPDHANACCRVYYGIAVL